MSENQIEIDALRRRAEHAEGQLRQTKVRLDALEAENERLRQELAEAQKMLAANEGRVKEIVSDELLARAERAEAELAGMQGKDMNAVERPCCGCGKPLLVENAWMEDGCPCNTPAGVNNLNLYRWRLLHELQQQQARENERLRAELATAHNDALEKAEDAMLEVFADMDRAYLFTSGFDNRIIDARDAIRALKDKPL